tara:strand:- start:31 stop:471 length:441 start_codon:yes stop_codon:yes gene_type:complete
MATLTVAEVRGRVDAALQAAPYVRSRHVPELFGLDTDLLLHKSYSVATPLTTVDGFDGREHYTDEGEAQTRVDVRTAYRLRGDGQSADYSAALDHEHLVLRTVMSSTVLTYLQLHVDGVPRRTVTPGGDWLISLIRFKVYHRFSFA